jgi:hypothetical protein
MSAAANLSVCAFGPETFPDFVDSSLVAGEAAGRAAEQGAPVAKAAQRVETDIFFEVSMMSFECGL